MLSCDFLFDGIAVLTLASSGWSVFPSPAASYLHYIRRQNPLPPIPPSSSTLPSAYLAARLQITQAYDFALSHVGLDPFATPIWREYLAFVREGEAKSTWEEQSRVSEVRALVGRAVRVPMEDLEAVWREYDAFEGQVNRLTVSFSSPPPLLRSLS